MTQPTGGPAAPPTLDDCGISPVVLDALEKDFIEVMKELSAEDNLDRFRTEYEKLHRSLKRSHESEKRLIKKCQELHEEIVANSAKVHSAIRLSQEDENTISSLRKEIEKTWKLVDSAHEKDSRAKDTIKMLKKEINRLNKLVDEGAGLTLGQESNLQELLSEKREYYKELEGLRQKVHTQTNRMKGLTDNVKRMEVEFAQKKAEEQLRNKMHTQLKREFDATIAQREAFDGRSKELHAAIERRTREIEAVKERQQEAHDNYEKLHAMFRADKESVHELQMQRDKTVRDLQHGTTNAEKITMQNDQVKKVDKPVAEKKKKAAEQALKQVQQKRKQNEEQLATQMQEVKVAEEAHEVEEQKVRALELEINKLIEVIDERKRTLEGTERSLKNSFRSKDLAVTIAVKHEGERVKLENETDIEAGKNRSSEHQLDALRSEMHALRKKALSLEMQREKYKANARDAAERHQTAMENVNLIKQRIVELRARLEDEEKRLKNQDTIYEQVLTERNMYSKYNSQAGEEIEQMERKFRITDQQIKQLKEELRKREADLCEAHSLKETSADASKRADETLKGVEDSLKEARESGGSLADEISQLTQIITDCDTEKSKQQMKFNAVTNERNILATQLIRRNEELALLHEKIRIQQSILLKGEAQYHERLANIAVFRNKANDLRVKLRKSLACIRYVEQMRRQIAALQRQLIQERTKVKALFEELQNPMNVHRWRKLDGSNPLEYENILKIQTLQRRLIAKSEESRQKQVIIKQKEKEYAQLKHSLARQPGPEIAEQLTVYHENVLKRTEQSKRMADELQNSQATVEEFDYEVKQLQEDLQLHKKKYYETKHKNTLLIREKQLMVRTARMPRAPYEGEFVVTHPINQPRFAGGGFCLSI